MTISADKFLFLFLSPSHFSLISTYLLLCLALVITTSRKVLVRVEHFDRPAKVLVGGGVISTPWYLIKFHVTELLLQLNFRKQKHLINNISANFAPKKNIRRVYDFNKTPVHAHVNSSTSFLTLLNFLQHRMLVIEREGRVELNISFSRFIS